MSFKMTKLVILILVLTTEWAITLEQDCPAKCECYPHKTSSNRQVVECTNIEPSELNALSGATTDLILKDGSWDSIDFGDLPSHLTKLLTISIYNYSTIHLWRYKDSKQKLTFNEVLNVSIQYTRINSIREGVFKFFPNGTHFILSNNRIDKISENPFSGLQNLEFINFSNNNIETIKHDTFKNLSLKTMDLSNNSINNERICNLINELPSTSIFSSISKDECNKLLGYSSSFYVYIISAVVAIFIILPICYIVKGYYTKQSKSSEKPKTERRIKYDPNKKLGRGVFKGWIVGDNREVAVKVSKLNQTIEDIEELDILTKLSEDGEFHNNVIQYLLTETDEEDRLIALMPVCDETLATAISTKNKKAMKHMTPGRDSCPEQLAKGLEFLHKHKVQHRDIKPDNILIKYEGSTARFIIADFDLGHITGKESSHKTEFGTMGWVAPELWGTEERSSKVDIFSMGCVFYYVLTQGEHPFGIIATKADRRKCQKNIEAKTPPMEENRELLLDHNFAKMQAKNLIECMLKFTGNDRPAASELLDHPFFWDDKKRINAFIVMGNLFETKNGTDYVDLQKILRDNSHKVFRNNDWKELITNQYILNSIRSNQKDDICSLVKVIRDKITHEVKIKANSTKQYEVYKKQGVRQYWETKFPCLLIEMYYAVKIFNDQTGQETKVVF